MTIENCVSMQGTKPFIEDCCGYKRDTIWVFDGATSLSDASKYSSWIVHDFMRYVHEGMYYATQEPCGDLKAIMQGSLRYAQAKLGGIVFDHPYDMLSFAGVVARLHDDHVEFLQAADVACVITDEKSTQRFDIEPAFAAQQKLARDEISSLNAHSDNYALEKRAVHRQIRSRMNTEGGYPIFSYDQQGVSQLEISRVATTGTYRVELYSDGWEAIRHDVQSRIVQSSPQGFDDATYIAARRA